MRFYQASLVMVCSCFIVAACGYTPVHSTRSPPQAGFPAQTQAPLKSVYLDRVLQNDSQDRNTRIAQIVRNELLDILGARGASTHSLSIITRQSIGDQTLQDDTSVTRKVLRLTAETTLTDMRSGETVYKTTIQATTSFNTPRNPYATLIAEQDAQNRAARLLAENITTYVSLFLAQETENR